MMSREIKFRQPILENNKFSYWQYWGFTEPGVFVCPTGPLASAHKSSQQFTGLHTTDGKEIYQKDILGGMWSCGYIDYCDKCKSFQYILKDFGCQSCSGDIHWDELVEYDGKLDVLGNLFENPELLEDARG